MGKAVTQTAEPKGPKTLDEKEALVYEHPDFRRDAPKFRKYLDIYNSEDVYKYIHKHIRESDPMYQQRIKRGYFYNYSASVIDLLVAYLFHSPITRDLKGLDEGEITEIYADADMKGTTFHIFIQVAEVFAQIFGDVGILVDAPKAPEGGYKNEQERKDSGHRPYLTLVSALQIKDWECDKNGKFEWVKIEINRPQDRTWMKTVDEDTRYFLIWTKKEWFVYSLLEDKVTQVESSTHDLGEVPLVILKNEKRTDDSWRGLSTIRDIADINIAILNWSSLADEEVFERCLNILAMEKEESDSPIELSHHNIIEYSPGAHPPEYLTPGTTPLELIGKQVDRAKDEIYRLAKLGGSTGLKGVREATSGIAYAYEFNETNQSLAKKAENLEQAENEIHRFIALWLDQKWEGQISYPHEFGVEDFMQEFQLLSEGRATLSSETAIKELETKICMKMFAKEPEALRNKIKGEIEASDPKGPGLLEGFDNVPAAPKIGGPGAGSQGSGSPKTGKSG